MVKFKKCLISLMVMLMIISNCLPVFAGEVGGISSQEALLTLVNAVASPTHTSSDEGYIEAEWDYSNRTYKKSEGGYYLYDDLTIDGDAGCRTPLDEHKLSELKTGAKKAFLTDYFLAGQSILDAEKKDNYSNGITEDVGTAWLDAVQNIEGVGTQLMTTLMAQTKPDYQAANRIYKPFSGTVGTILGVISILIFAALALTMVLDLAYIAIPTFQLFVDGDGGNGGDGKGKKSFISQEARDAVSMAVGGSGSSGQNGGSNKLAVSIYFKKRVLMLCVLGICMLYLVSGQIFALVGMFLDLFSGFLGF